MAVTYGEEGAALFEGGKQVAGSGSPRIVPVDGTGAGDAFAACLVVSLLEELPYQEALQRACKAGAYAAATIGAQRSLPLASDIADWPKDG